MLELLAAEALKALAIDTWASVRTSSKRQQLLGRIEKELMANASVFSESELNGLLLNLSANSDLRARLAAVKTPTQLREIMKYSESIAPGLSKLLGTVHKILLNADRVEQDSYMLATMSEGIESIRRSLGNGSIDVVRRQPFAAIERVMDEHRDLKGIVRNDDGSRSLILDKPPTLRVIALDPAAHSDVSRFLKDIRNNRPTRLRLGPDRGVRVISNSQTIESLLKEAQHEPFELHARPAPMDLKVPVRFKTESHTETTLSQMTFDPSTRVCVIRHAINVDSAALRFEFFVGGSSCQVYFNIPGPLDPFDTSVLPVLDLLVALRDDHQLTLEDPKDGRQILSLGFEEAPSDLDEIADLARLLRVIIRANTRLPPTVLAEPILLTRLDGISAASANTLLRDITWALSFHESGAVVTDMSMSFVVDKSHFVETPMLVIAEGRLAGDFRASAPTFIGSTYLYTMHVTMHDPALKLFDTHDDSDLSAASLNEAVQSSTGDVRLTLATANADVTFSVDEEHRAALI